MADLSPSQIAYVAHQAGLSWDKVKTAVEIALAESGGNATALNNNPSTGDLSYGLWQINMIDGLGLSRAQQWGICTDADVRSGKCGMQMYAQLFNPLANAKAMMAVSNSGSDWSPWTTYTRGTYAQYDSVAAQAVADAKSGNVTGGTSNLTSVTPVPATDSGQAQTNQTSGGCAHQVSLPAGINLCLDKPLAVVQIGGGVLILLVGAVILGAALISGAFPGVREAAKTTLPVARVVKGARRAGTARRAAQGRVEASQARSQAGQVREGRASELHAQRVAVGRARVRTARARARSAEGKARPGFVVLGGREVPRSDPLAQAALRAKAS